MASDVRPLFGELIQTLDQQTVTFDTTRQSLEDYRALTEDYEQRFAVARKERASTIKQLQSYLKGLLRE